MFSRVVSALLFWRQRPTQEVVVPTSPSPSPTEVHVFTTEVKTVTDDPESAALPCPITTPPPAAYYSPIQLQDSLMSDFFGGRTGGGTSTVRSRDSQVILPPYSPTSDSEVLPAYPGHPRDEPATLARYMFVYGFFFPPFWLMGIAILLSPLRATPEWEMGKTEEEKVALLNRLRTDELKWAKRCLWATLALLALIAVVAVVIYLAVFRK